MERGAPIDLARGELPAATVMHLLQDLPFADVLTRGYNYCDAAGSPALRDMFLQQLARVATRIEDTLVTHGALGAIDLALRTQWTPPRRFVTFDPTYREALTIARAHGLPAVAIPRPAESAVDLADLLRSDDIVYVVPTWNNPDGFSLSSGEIELLATALARTGATLIEDDAYQPLDMAAQRPSVTALVTSLRPTSFAIRLQSFSKIACPGARCCVVEGSRAAITAMSSGKMDFGTSPLAAEFVTALLAGGVFDQLRYEIADTLHDHRSAALMALKGWPEPIDPGNGYFLWIPFGVGDSAAIAAGLESQAGVKVAAGAPFQVTPGTTAQLRVSIAWEPIDRLVEGCRILLEQRLRNEHGVFPAYERP
ncbi:aminotransferase class I/II-fold pyridoxal phosphate-dependent enzyme [Nocardia brevicatena]|uniref:aminotransferase class I/II-fold pyridoxal phosphate-dependent enzyme n=1 Tax=Nocardia brevicatena TaxID=37327 RepID=UPI00059423F0|nr:aminotransferase class I/II-fold pyridoxal phosphate-dependent enzyme [Nocardia brevicatena]